MQVCKVCSVKQLVELTCILIMCVLLVSDKAYIPSFVGQYNFMNLQGICCLDVHLSLLSKVTGVTGYVVHVVSGPIESSAKISVGIITCCIAAVIFCGL